MPTPNPQPPAPAIAIFDFDHTLIEHDSFWAFLSLACGWPRTGVALAEALAVYGAGRLQKDPAVEDHRTFIKDILLRRLLAGRRVDGLAPAVEKLGGWMRWKEPMRRALIDHRAQGHHIVIASGGLDLYLPELLKDMPYDALICTAVEVKDGIITGHMSSGNCVRLRKAELVKDYLAQKGPFAESWGYGNLPHDLPMLELVKHRIVV